jgi:hypothetical protein
MKSIILIVGCFILSGLNAWRFVVDGHTLNLVAFAVSGFGGSVLAYTCIRMGSSLRSR